MEKETNVEFAAITENNEFFSENCGIWEFGYWPLSMDRKPTLFDTFSASMRIHSGFALHICSRTSNVTKSGNMFLGGYSSVHVAEPMRYVPVVKKDWYQVRLDGFKIISTGARTVEVVVYGVSMPIYIFSFLKIKLVPEDQLPEGYVDLWWYGFVSSTSPDAVKTEATSEGDVLPGSVGTILGETLFSEKIVCFEQAEPGEADYGRIGFARGNCFASANHRCQNSVEWGQSRRR
ncbi:hypothetical protein BGX21_007519 [Mortierella sp. AD011]|nr:hypothetical protein BGX20_007642 [Mortierella sp. AD010]KAF9398631.1 hypothetical protein BGX21_007519 [Mortierella sp. AD011]